VIRVLLVDDQEPIRAGVRGILRKQFAFQVVGECTHAARWPQQSAAYGPMSC
jgi:DNA-binding NarL/FixJ family response regulator